MSGFVVAAHLTDGVWNLRVVQRSVPDGLAPLVRRLRDMRAEGVLLGLVSVDDDWAALVRPAPGGARLLLGDSTVTTMVVQRGWSGDRSVVSMKRRS